MTNTEELSIFNRILNQTEFDFFTATFTFSKSVFFSGLNVLILIRAVKFTLPNFTSHFVHQFPQTWQTYLFTSKNQNKNYFFSRFINEIMNANEIETDFDIFKSKIKTNINSLFLDFMVSFPNFDLKFKTMNNNYKKF